MNDVSLSQQLVGEVITVVAKKMNVEANTLTADTDLFAAGLDSITLMSLVAHWRAAGYAVNFATLSREPRAQAWAQYLAQTQATKNVETSVVTSPVSPSISRQSQAPFPLAPMQFAYWLGRDSSQPLGGVSAHLYTEFHGTDRNIDAERLSKALALLSERHSSLRLKVTTDGLQTHLPAGHVAKLQLNDLRKKTEAEANVQLEAWRTSFSSQILEVEAGQVLAIALSLLPDGSTRLHLDIDMMAADAVSYRTLLRELALLFETPDITLPTLPVSYKDCRVAAENNWPTVQKNAGSWWQERLHNLPDGPQLPLKKHVYQQQKDADISPHTTRRHFHFDAKLRNTLYARCREHGLTPAAVLATVMAETLAGWSAEPRFLLNIPLFLRPMDGPDVSGVVGDFSSSVLLDVDTCEPETFNERAKQVQSRLHEYAAHAEYGGVQILRDLGRLKGRQVTAPVVFTSALNLGELFDPAVRRVFGDPVWIISQGPQVLLDTQITELDGGLLFNWDCREDAFVDGVLDAMFDFFQKSVSALINTPASWSQCLADTLPAHRVHPEPIADSMASVDQPVGTPQTPVERAVAAVWSEVLGGDGANVNQNLFAAGGDSVLASSLVAQLREIFGVQTIDMQRLFYAPTIAGLAEAINASGDQQQIAQIAGIYCEILDLNDSDLIAELEKEA